MYLLKCHIENFGKFTDFDYEFNKGLNVINKENGWGKTTLSIFIKAIFYGMTSSQKHNLDDNDRKLYQPSNNGKYGGYIDFVKEGKEYRLERYFGKTESSDFCNLTDLSTGKPHPEGAKSWGERLFGVNCDAFLRTLFLCQKDIDLSNNKSISDKIGNVYQETDNESIDKALKILDKKRVELKHKNGKGGLIFDKKEKLSEVNSNIERCKMAVLAVETIENKVIEAEKEIIKVEKDLKKVSELAKEVREVEAIKERKKLFDEKNDKKEKLSLKLALNLKILENSNATLNDVEQKIADCSEIVALKNDVKDSEIKLHDLSEKRQKINSTYLTNPTFNDLQELTLLSNARTEIETNISEKEILSVSTKNNKFSLLLTILSAVMLVTGVIIALFGSVIFGAIVAVTGFVGAFVGLILYVTKSIKINATYNSKNDTSEVLEVRKLNIETQILSLKTKLGLVDLGLTDLAGKLTNDLDKLSDISASEKHLKEYIADKSNKIIEKENDVIAFLSQFNLPNEYKTDNYKELLNKIVLIMRDIIAFEEEIIALEKDIETLKSNGIIISEELFKINKSEIDEKEKELSSLLIQKRNNLSLLKNNQKDCYLQQERLTDLEEEATLLSEEIFSLINKYNLVTKTIELLSEARKDLSEKYLAPITNGVNYYLKRLTGKEDKIYLDTEYKVNVEIGGELKSIDYCSLGWKNIYSLALRFAFIDEVYKDVSIINRPFIILDDPFVNFDDGNLALTLNAINEISKERQIIYFVCHDSRIYK